MVDESFDMEMREVLALRASDGVELWDRILPQRRFEWDWVFPFAAAGLAIAIAWLVTGGARFDWPLYDGGELPASWSARD